MSSAVESQTILTLNNVEKVYPNGVRALKNINFKVRAGEFLVVIGLSGSGKSTLLRCLNHLHETTSGKIYFQNEDVTHARGAEIQRLRRGMAMIFQHFNLVGRHTVLSNVLMGSLGRTATWRSVFGWFVKPEIEKAIKLLELVGIADKAYMRASSLSGGQQQRVAIARALMQDPKILLADEPVASLDPATCHAVMDYLEKANRELGITIICNLHFLSLVRRYATRVIALKAGELVFEGAPTEIDEKWFRQIYGEAAKEVHIE